MRRLDRAIDIVALMQCAHHGEASPLATCNICTYFHSGMDSGNEADGEEGAEAEEEEEGASTASSYITGKKRPEAYPLMDKSSSSNSHSASK